MKAVRIMQLFVLLPVFALVACAAEQDAPPDAPASVASVDEGQPYAFDSPDAASALPDELVEISGLTTLDDGSLAAVQDEEGILFILDPGTGAVTERIPFGDGGDYEGVELAGERLFVLRSNGNLLELTGWAAGNPDVRDHKTDLKGKNDTEGLAYDAANGRLLIVTKEDPGAGLDDDRYRAIYAFDLESGTLASEPAFVIDLEALAETLPDAERFKPSALAVHPATGEIYVLSSTVKAIVVLGTDGDVRQVWPLPEESFEQPEGLAFLPSGDLFVSSEGVDGPAMLYRFAARSGS